MRLLHPWPICLLLLLAISCSTAESTSEPPADVAPLEVQDAAAPVTIEAIAPDTVGPLGGETVVLTGHGFSPDAVIRFGDQEAINTKVLSSERIEAEVPPLLAGQYYVRVDQPDATWDSQYWGLVVRTLDIKVVEAPPHSFPPFQEMTTQCAAAGLFNGDAHIDLILAQGNQLRLLHGQGNGNYLQATAEPDPSAPLRFPELGLISDLVAADWNQDGLTDLLVTFGEERPPTMLWHQTDGTFQASESFPILTGWVASAVTGDVNQDGALDLILLARQSPEGNGPQHHYLVGDPGTPGEFALAPGESWTPVTDSVACAVLADLDRDGDLDLVTGTTEAALGQHGQLYLNDQGTLVQGDMGALPPLSSPIHDLVAFDADGDQDKDLYISADGQDLFLRNDGNAHFFNDSTKALPVDNVPGGSVAPGDLNLDGRPDLLLGHFGYQNRLYLNDGKGRFVDQTPTLPMAATDTAAVLLGDADANGTRDIFLFGGMNTANQLLLTVDGGGMP